MDQLNLTILSLLKQDSRLSNKEIGAQVHLTGQAVGQRINHLIDQQTLPASRLKSHNSNGSSSDSL